MGNNKPVEKKRKKKGRPSLLDLQKRSLRLQKQQQQQKPNPNPNPNPKPNPNPNPYLRFPSSVAPRRPARRNPDPAAAADDEDDDDDDDDEDAGKKREKKLKLVLRLPNRSANSASDLASSGSESDAPRKRKIHAVAGDHDKGERHNSSSKATDDLQGDPSDSGPTTPLPDKKLLVFILDRVQKKDTYGVFSEPVDPEELPDYHDIIEHPMDFGTVRKKLASGAYANLEQFEKDVYLISSNAMRYNSPNTIYYRQARSIQELAKKNFENLRQESDDNEPEPKTVRRGRPPSKSTIKRTIGRPAERTGSDFSSDATLANAGDNSHWSNLANDSLIKGSVLDRPGTAGVSTKASLVLRNTETYSWASDHKLERNEEYSGSMVKGAQTKYGKKPSIVDENRRNTYKQSELSAYVQEPLVFTTFDGEKKLLVPVGLQMELAYARSLARFAAKLGPIGWEIAAKRIERVLPPGTKFGRGWVGDSEAPQHSQQPLLSTSPPHPSSQPKTLPGTAIPKGGQHLDRQEPPAANNKPIEEAPSSRTVSTSASASAAPNRSSDPAESAQPGMVSNHDGGFTFPGGSSSMRQKTPFQLHQNPAMQPTMNGFNTAYGFNLLSQVDKMARTVKPPGTFGSEAAMMTHARALDMVSKSHNIAIHHAPANQLDVAKAKLVGNTSAVNSGSPLDPSHDSQGQQRGSSLNPKPDPIPPDLNVGFQPPGSPVSGVLVDSQQPDLALQL